MLRIQIQFIPVCTLTPFLSDYFEALKCSQAKKDTRKSCKLCEELIRIPRLALLAATVFLLEQFIGTQLVKILTAFLGTRRSILFK